MGRENSTTMKTTDSPGVDGSFAFEPAHRLAKALRERRISSRELLGLYLLRLESVNPRVNSVVTVNAGPAQAQAEAADQLTVSGADLGPLHGLPMTVKDAIEVAGIRSTGGSAQLADHVPERDAPAVARLRDAGAIVYGKTNVPEWSGDIQTYNDSFGTTKNPWDLSRTTGGSSGGSAASVATGLTSFELGTDFGGSVRIPSSFCGVFGHKPSFGLVSQRGYLDHVGAGTTDVDINVFGPLARSAEDLDLLLSVLAGPNRAEARAWRVELPPPRNDSLESYRVGVWLDDPACPVDEEVLSPLQEAVDAVARAGARVSETRPGIGLADARRLFHGLIAASASLHDPPEIGDAAGGTHRSWLEMDKERAAMRGIWAAWFEDHDVLLCPVMPTAAFPHDHAGDIGSRTVVINGSPRTHRACLSWTDLISVAYLPSSVVPAGFTTAGMPVGIQVVAPFLEDRTGIDFGRRLAELTGGYTPPPSF
jgi:amidase